MSDVTFWKMIAAIASAISCSIVLGGVIWRIIIYPNLQQNFVTKDTCSDCKTDLSNKFVIIEQKLDTIRMDITLLKQESHENQVNIKWIKAQKT